VDPSCCYVFFDISVDVVSDGVADAAVTVVVVVVFVAVVVVLSSWTWRLEYFY